jgi:hypothetical protein
VTAVGAVPAEAGQNRTLPVFIGPDETRALAHVGLTDTVQEITTKMAPWNGHICGAFPTFDGTFGPGWQTRAAAVIYAVHGMGVPNSPELRILMVSEAEHNGLMDFYYMYLIYLKTDTLEFV